jgi:site-specific recombinase XerD
MPDLALADPQISPYLDPYTEHLSLDLMIAAWLDAKAGRSRSPKTARAYRDTIANFRVMLQQLGLDLDGDAGRIAIVAQGWAGLGQPAAATYNQRLAIVSSFYTYAIRRQLLHVNPIMCVERRCVQPYAHSRALSYDEVQRCLTRIDRTTPFGARDYALLLIAVQTGRRLSELANLCLGDLRIDGGVVTVTWRRCKGGKTFADRLVPVIGQSLLQWLEQVYGPTVSVWPMDAPVWVSLARNGTRGQPLSQRGIERICDRRLGIGSAHVLRHTFAQLMEDAGAKVSEIQARLGHASLATTGQYLAALKRANNPHATVMISLLGLNTEETIPL